MKIPKFNDFSKNRKIYENQPGLMPEPSELSDELPMANQPQTKPLVPTKPSIPTKPEKTPIKQPVETPQRKASSEEEESSDDIENKLTELSDLLGQSGYDVNMANNSITVDVDGKTYKIEFVSETMSFSIDGKVNTVVGGKKVKFETPEDVLNFINSTETQTPHEAPSLTGREKGGQQRPISEKKTFHKHKRKY